MTDYEVPEEAHILVKELAATKLLILAVLGHHDLESGKEREVRQIICDAGVTALDGKVRAVCSVGFAGIKGFAGGFGRRVLGAWGEENIKCFVRETVDEVLKLESAFAKLQAPQRIAIWHEAKLSCRESPLACSSFSGW